MNNSYYTQMNNTSFWKQEVFIATQKIYNLAERCLRDFPSLERIIMVKRIPRYDSRVNANLSEFGNSVLDDLWFRNGSNNKIVIAKQDLECEGWLRVQRFGNINQNNYDGIHMRGPLATQHMTKTFVRMLCRIYPHLNPTKPEEPAQPTFATGGNRVQLGGHYNQDYPLF